MPNEMTTAPDACPDRARAIIDGMIAGYKLQPRSPLLKSPASQGLEFESVSFPSEDGVPLEAWFIPRSGSDKLIIANHPRYFSRYGFPSHLEPWKSMFAVGGNDFEVDFIPDYKILHDADYNVLTYDLRNLGHSGAGNGGISSGGVLESRDVIGSLRYARARPDLGKMRTALFSRCLGCNATLFAIAGRPEEFAGVRALVGVQPLSPRRIIERVLALNGIGEEGVAEVARGIEFATSFAIDAMSPIAPSSAVQLPTFLYGVREDVLTKPSDLQAMFDNIPAAEKELFWIEGSTRRWDGYTYFARHPQRMLQWFAKFI